MIIKLGGKPRSALFMERDRDDSGQLTRWLTGRRFMYIEVPPAPLPPRAILGPFKPTIFHFEQKAHRQTKCGRCLEEGHASSTCQNDIKCLACHELGHKRGSPQCTLIDSVPDTPIVNANITADDDKGNKSTQSPPDDATAQPTGDSQRGETPKTQQNRASRSLLQSTVPFPRRHRSYTPAGRKRPLNSPTSQDSPGKCTRLLQPSTSGPHGLLDSANPSTSTINANDMDEGNPSEEWG